MAGKRRRHFLKLTGAALVAAPYLWRRDARAAGGRVVVIGGGAGGAAAARLLATAGKGLEIALVEPKTSYVTCFFSNLYIGGLRSLESLTHNYAALSERYGVKLMHQVAVAIDPAGRTVRLAGGDMLSWDRLIVAPGIDFRWDAIEGYGPEAARIMPHAWQAGEQTALLRRQLEAMEDGGTFLIAPPDTPYRCPTAPYERASLVAHYFKREKPKSRIIILDAKNDFPLQDLFEEAWTRFHPGMIEVLPADFAGGIKGVNPAAMTVMAEDEAFAVAVANVIPPQTAGRIAVQSDLADRRGWCPVDPMTFESTHQPGIHVIGDAALASPMPKAAYAAYRQAEICARAVVEALSGEKAAAGVLGGACWSHVAPDHAVRERAAFAVIGGALQRIELEISPTGESDAVRAAAARQGGAWYDGITAGMFG
ncbi:MAG: NAD(P)/FAD-dependent oxidoreductase [Alphaproteobacteria bacterium]|nr:NAD(P)/FAD-dependent oxidoreductase [Alphaproteobacteria bacterium]